MSPEELQTISRIFDAAICPDLWPAALDALVEMAGATGGAYIVRDNRTRRIAQVCFTGPALNMRAAYVDHYSRLDPYLPIVETAPRRGGIWLRRSLPASMLQRDEWYNDFILKIGVDDIWGVQLYDTWSHSVFLGLHKSTDQPELASERVAAVEQLLGPLSRAAQLNIELRRMALGSALAAHALDRLPIGVIIADRRGRVVEMNRAAERIAARGDGLTIRNGQIAAGRAFETSRLARFVATAATDRKTIYTGGRMLLVRNNGSRPYVLAVTPLGEPLTVHDQPLALILVVDPEMHAPSEHELVEFFGLSPAESRLAASLMAGLDLAEIAAKFNVRITTLRTQLSAILRKAGADRQAELIRLLSGTGIVSGLDPIAPNSGSVSEV